MNIITEWPEWLTTCVITISIAFLIHKSITIQYWRRSGPGSDSGAVLDSNWEERARKLRSEPTPLKKETVSSNKSNKGTDSNPAFVTNIKDLTQWENIRSKAVSSGKPLIVKFTATWCGPCKRIDPIYVELASNYMTCAIFVRIDVDELYEISEKYGVVSMPTFLVLGGEHSHEVGRISGSTEVGLKQLIDLHCGNVSNVKHSESIMITESKNKDTKNESITSNQSKKQSTQSIPRTVPQSQEQERPLLKSSTNHPGLSQFHNYYSAISDLYRQYIISTNTNEAPAPIIPRSERGLVKIHLEVLNSTSSPIDVFWVDYKGREEWKGSAAPGYYWTQITWIGHPWTFRAQGGNILLHYVPYRVIPTTNKASTITRNGEAIQRFSISNPSYFSIAHGMVCDIKDNIMPYPAKTIKSIDQALKWSYRQMERDGTNPRTLIKYLYNIVYNPSDPKYRQIRTANKRFWSDVWCNAGRGVLHALGFEENGPYAEIGPPDGTLSSERVKQVSRVIYELEGLQAKIEGKSAEPQPEGANGYGRAGFGRVGMN